MNPGLRGLTAENPQMTPGRRGADSFAEPYNANPMQTPVLRRTDHIPPYEPPKEKSIVWTVLAALVMVGVIGFGAYKLKPVLYDVRHPESRIDAAANANASAPSATTAPTSTSDASTPQPDATSAAAQNSPQPAATQPQANAAPEKSDEPSAQQNAAQNSAQNPSDVSATPTVSAAQPTQIAAPEKTAAEKTPTAVAASEKTVETPRKTVAPVKAEPVLSAKAAQVKQKIDDALAARNLTGKASVQGVGNTLTITGKLRPGQHSALLNLLHDVPAGVKIVDNIGDDSTAAAAPSAAAPSATPVAPAPSNAAAAAPIASAEAAKPTGTRVAWADVKSFPVGAEIFVDEKSTGQTTPARVQVPSGVHVFTLHLEGFRDVRRGVDVSDGGTVEVRGLLRRNK